MGKSTLMKVLLPAALVLAGAIGASGSGAASDQRERQLNWDARARYVADEVIVGFRQQASRADRDRVHGRVPARVKRHFQQLGMEVVKLRPGISVPDAIRSYKQDEAVAFAEPNFLRSPDALPTESLLDLWGLNNTGQLHPVADATLDDTADDSSGTSDADIDAPEAWAGQQGNDTGVVAVLDTGVDASHPDLSGQLWTNPGESCVLCLPAVDDDHNGLIDDLHGWDFADNDATLLSGNDFEGFEHGTHVAGTIAGAPNNNGIVGVCPGCKVMVLKIARDSDGQFMTSAEIAALNYAKSKGVKIANMSFGGPSWSNSEREAIRTSGLLAVISAANDALDNDMFLQADVVGNSDPDVFSPAYPASFTLGNILTVGASNDRDENGYSTECHAPTGLDLPKTECAFTNWGHDSVDLAAPGVDIMSSFPGGGYVTFDGTSMAAPHVAGVAGLVLSQHPTYTVAQLKNAVMRSVDKPATLRTIYMPSYVTGVPHTKTGSFSRTAGRVNALNALTAGTANATVTTDGNINGAKGMSTATVKGSVSWPADINDVWKKRLSKGHLYRITLVVPTGKDYDLFVWKPRTKEVWQPGKLQGASRHVGSADEGGQFLAGSTGMYYFHVSAWLFKSGSYKLTLKKIA
jgi:subtilisin family serine protease